MKRSSAVRLPPHPQPNRMAYLMKNRFFDFPLLFLLLLGLFFTIFVSTRSLKTLFSSSYPEVKSSTIIQIVTYRDELDKVLAETSTENKTVIIAVVNKAYVEGDKSMLDLFLDGFWLGDGTQDLVDHILIVATDPVSYKRCKFLRLHCYMLETEGVDFAEEKIYMSEDFLKMVWRRTQFLGDVLKRGYNFIFTDTDILWLRNPFFILNPNATFDFQITCDVYQGNEVPCNVNSGLLIARSNNKTISLYDTWYAKRKAYAGKNEQQVLQKLMQDGLFRELGLDVRYLDTLYFSSFSENSRDVGAVVTVHANFCRSISAKLADLTTVIQDWKRAKKLFANETSTFKWSEHIACINSWKN